MALRFRLARFGTKKRPFYRIVVADSRAPRDGKFVEKVGTYNPLSNPAKITIDREKVIEWYKKGARPTDTVKNIFQREGILSELSKK